MIIQGTVASFSNLPASGTSLVSTLTTVSPIALVTAKVARVSGNIYYAGTSGNTTSFYRLTPTNTQTQIYTFTGANFQGTGVAMSVQEICVDSAENVYYIDGQYSASIYKMLSNSSYTPVRITLFTQPPLASTFLWWGSGLTIDPQSNLYVAHNNGLYKMTPSGVLQYVNSSGVTGTPNRLDFSSVTGNIYYVAQQTASIYKINANTSNSVLLAGSGSVGFADGTGASAQFNSPWGLVVDASENVYVADQVNQRIRKITPAGVVTTVAGSGGVGSNNGPGNTASFYNPMSLGVSSDSKTVYVADRDNYSIRSLSLLQSGYVYITSDSNTIYGYNGSSWISGGSLPSGATGPTGPTGSTANGITRYLYGSGTTSSGTLAVTFSTAFASAPNVTATISGSTAAFINVSTITTTGFTVNTYNISGTLTNYTFNWHAVL